MQGAEDSPAILEKLNDLAGVFTALIEGAADTPDQWLENFLRKHPGVSSFVGTLPAWLQELQPPTDPT